MKKEQQTPKLRFTPTAWAKLLYLRDLGDTEVGGMGISAADDPLLIEDFRLVKQTCTSVNVEFSDDGWADFFETMLEEGYKLEQFGRVWMHTHPQMSARPSGTDETTFARAFSKPDWAVMFIISRTEDVFARLRFSFAGNPVEMEIPVVVDYSTWFDAPDFDLWEAEYKMMVTDDDDRWLRWGRTAEGGAKVVPAGKIVCGPVTEVTNATERQAGGPYRDDWRDARESEEDAWFDEERKKRKLLEQKEQELNEIMTRTGAFTDEEWDRYENIVQEMNSL